MSGGYDYAAHIPAPADLGVSTDGSLGSTGNDISAGLTYVQYLINGPNLGDKRFINTGAQCTDPSGNTVDRYDYIDNTADQGFMPGSFAKFGGSTFQGLIPGILGQLEDLVPTRVMDALAGPGVPQCRRVACPSGDVTTGLTSESHYVQTSDVQDLLSNYGCSEGFQSREDGVGGVIGAVALLCIPVVAMLVAAKIR